MTRVYFSLCVSILSNFLQSSHAQSIADVTEQLILDEQKLVTLKSTLNEMYDGYERLQQGYLDIRNIAKGNYSLHRAFLDALLLVSPGIRSDQKVQRIIQMETRLVGLCRAAANGWVDTGSFSPQELEYIVNTYSALLDWCQRSIRELDLVLTDNELRMSDAERMEAVERISAEVNDQEAIFLDLDHMLSIQTALRLKEKGDINTLKSIYGIPN